MKYKKLTLTVAAGVMATTMMAQSAPQLNANNIDEVIKGYVTGKLVEHFLAERINDPDNFVSLLFYFVMVTIDGTYKGDTRFVIPNEVVRDQMYTYLLDTYKDMVDSYIIELKYCKSSTTDEQVGQLFKDASAQINRYADSDIVRESVKTTKLHKLVVIYRGAEIVACDEAMSLPVRSPAHLSSQVF